MKEEKQMYLIRLYNRNFFKSIRSALLLTLAIEQEFHVIFECIGSRTYNTGTDVINDITTRPLNKRNLKLWPRVESIETNLKNY